MTTQTVDHYDELAKVAGPYEYALIVNNITYLYEDAKSLILSIKEDFGEEEKSIYSVCPDGSLLALVGKEVDETV